MAVFVLKILTTAKFDKMFGFEFRNNILNIRIIGVGAF